MWESGFRQGTLQRPPDWSSISITPDPLVTQTASLQVAMSGCQLPLWVLAASSFGALPFFHFGSSVVKNFVIVQNFQS